MYNNWNEAKMVKKNRGMHLLRVFIYIYIGFYPIKNEKKSMVHDENVFDKIIQLKKILIFINI